MKALKLFLWEWKHFIRSPFKIIALLLFVISSVYGLHKGANLYHKQTDEIETIEQSAQENRQEALDNHYIPKIYSVEGYPWVDYQDPFFGIWYSTPYHYKRPSPAMVYSIGQSEQFGFYKRIIYGASPYDSDLAEEIANPERLQTGTLDFSFALLFLLPLVLLVLLYNLKSAESEQGFLALIEVQMPARNRWLLIRMCFYIVLSLLVVIGLLFYGATLTKVFETTVQAFGQQLLFSTLYLLFWSAIYFFILRNGKSILGNTLKMSAIFLVFAFIIPAAVHQILSILKPANLMTDLMDVRDKKEALYKLSDSSFQKKLIEMYPQMDKSPAHQDSLNSMDIQTAAYNAITNAINKNAIQPIEEENLEKNRFIANTFWFNPVSFFQNKFNAISETHYDDYQDYRNEIQTLIDQQLDTMILDIWNGVKVDESKFREYYETMVIE